jgi:hypothetical protein
MAAIMPGCRSLQVTRPGQLLEPDTHLGYVVSGRIHIASTDGADLDLGPGDAYRIDPGHDAWVVGDEPLVALEFESTTADTYAKG